MSDEADRTIKGPMLRIVSDERDGSVEEERIHLVLYVAGQTTKSQAAIANLRRLCEQHLDETCSVEVVDVSRDPARAVADQVLALPTLVRRLPPPIKRIIGTLTDSDRVLMGLQIRPRSAA